MSLTDAPWITDNDGDIVSATDSGGGIVCRRPDPYDYPMSSEHWESNARLIAAAPDLLAACQKALDAFGGEIIDSPLTGDECDRFAAILELTAAIAKAKGPK